MRPEAFIPVRVKSNGKAYVGDDKNTIGGYQSGYTDDIILATAESVLTSDVVDTGHRRAVARAVDESILEYETYEDEVNSPLGRSEVEIVLEEGPDAYAALSEKVRDNSYLYAAVHSIPVSEAAEHLEKESRLYLENGEGGLTSIGKKYGNGPNLTSATIVNDEGEEFSRDLRTFIPTTEWVLDNWGTIGYRSRKVSGRDVSSEDLAWLEDVARDDFQPDAVDTVFHESKGSYTAHFVRGVEESPVEDEADRIRYLCGRKTRNTEGTLRLDVIPQSIELNVCGNCEAAR